MKTFKEFQNLNNLGEIEDFDLDDIDNLLEEGKITMALAERKIASHSKKVKSEKDPIKQNILISRMIHTLAVSLTYLNG